MKHLAKYLRQMILLFVVSTLLISVAAFSVNAKADTITPDQINSDTVSGDVINSDTANISTNSVNELATTSKVGTASQVAAAVAASPKNNSISKANAATIGAAANGYFDWPWATGLKFKGKDGCVALTDCVSGATTSKNTIVLYGDSHASMWLPAIAPWAKANNYKLVLLWAKGCPIVNLGNNYSILGGDNAYYGNGGVLSASQCNTFRNNSIAEINSIHPKLVILGERTAQIVNTQSNTLFSTQKWSTELVTTINKINSPKTKVALLEDIPYLKQDVIRCISIHSSAVQGCSVSYPNTQPMVNGLPGTGQQDAESQSASKTGATLVKTIPLMCTANNKTCSPIINGDISYYDISHVSTTYAIWVSGVLTSEIQKAL